MGAKDKLVINGEVHPIVFNFNVYRDVCRKYNIPLNELWRIFEGSVELDFDQMDRQVDLILFAIKEGYRMKGGTCYLSIQDIYAELSVNINLIQEAIGYFIDSQPKPDSEVEKKS